jgi:hypothetical protein
MSYWPSTFRQQCGSFNIRDPSPVQARVATIAALVLPMTVQAVLVTSVLAYLGARLTRDLKKSTKYCESQSHRHNIQYFCVYTPDALHL